MCLRSSGIPGPNLEATQGQMLCVGDKASLAPSLVGGGLSHSGWVVNITSVPVIFPKRLLQTIAATYSMPHIPNQEICSIPDFPKIKLLLSWNYAKREWEPSVLISS